MEEVVKAAFPVGEQRAALWLELGRRPNPGCRHCNGKGYTGVNDEGKYVLCRCVKPRPTKQVVDG